MKKLVILFFLFLGGLYLGAETNNVYAANMDSKSTIYFTDTYVYTPTPEVGSKNGETPTGNPPLGRNQDLPKTGESKDITIQMVGSLFFVVSMILKIHWKKELDDKIN
ncbi:LPXTG cell wall anchor domain-containing protein [Enterococcus faecalis]|nr:LPXTG cell wall anchor domain-containing protein [Enterococcus faecalis]EJW9248982.1 LPXTG cell wall anchor domain-containing protein [Enterococcus faecalis]